MQIKAEVMKRNDCFDVASATAAGKEKSDVQQGIKVTSSPSDVRGGNADNTGDNQADAGDMGFDEDTDDVAKPDAARPGSGRDETENMRSGPT